MKTIFLKVASPTFCVVDITGDIMNKTEIELRLDMTLQENLNLFYEKRKKLARKLERLKKVLEENLEKLSKLKSEEEEMSRKKEIIIKRAKRPRQWYEKFHWFFTSGGRLAIGGRNASQNDILYSRYFEDNDLFFHADIHGGSVVILKDGTNASDQELQEAATFAACYSKGWTTGTAALDVYALKREQVSKHAHGGYIGKGGFALKGERLWFRNMKLKLTLYSKRIKDIEVLHVHPGDIDVKPKVVIVPGKKKKGEIAKKVLSVLNVDHDEVIQALPGPSEIIEIVKGD